MELVSNSLRAHREKAVKEKIVLRIQGEKGRTLVRLRDLGGGFDISKLPYDITQPVNEIDTISDAFEAYRQKTIIVVSEWEFCWPERCFPVSDSPSTSETALLPAPLSIFPIRFSIR